MYFSNQYKIATFGSLFLTLALNASAEAVQLTGQKTVLIESYTGQINSFDLPLPEIGLTPTGPISFTLNSESQVTTPLLRFDFDAGTIYAQADIFSTSPLQTTLGFDPILLSLKETGTITTPFHNLSPGSQVLNLSATAGNGGQIISTPNSPLNGLRLDLWVQYNISLPVDVLENGQFTVTGLGTIQSTLNYEFSAPGYQQITTGSALGNLIVKPVPEPSTVFASLFFSIWITLGKWRKSKKQNN